MLKAGIILSAGGGPPASSRRIRHPTTCDNRDAITPPADPDPTGMQEEGREKEGGND